MGSKEIVHLRLPRHMLFSLTDMAEESGSTVSGTVRSIVVDEIKSRQPDEKVKKPEMASLTFLVPDGFREKAAQAALASGVSINSLYVQILSENLGVLPCDVVEEAEDEA